MISLILAGMTFPGNRNRASSQSSIQPEDAVSESERQFRAMADAAPVMMWVTGPDRLCTFVNRSWLDFTGRTLEQEWGNGWVEGVHPDDRDRSIETYTAAFEVRERFEMEYRLRRHDGKYRWILDTGAPRFTPEGVFAGYTGSCIDITERQESEARHRASEARLAAMIDSATAGIISINAQQQITGFNRAAERLFGWSAADVLDKPLDILLPATFRAAHSRHITEFGTTEQGRAIEGALSALKRDGTIFPVEATISHATVEGEQIFTAIVRDVSERTRTENALRESEDRLRRLAESAFEGIILSQNNWVFDANIAFCKMHGSTVESLRGAPFLALIAPDYRELVRRKRDLRDEAIFEAECLRADGTIFPAELRQRQTSIGGQPAWVTAIRDISERRQNEAALQTERDHLAQITAVTPNAIFSFRLRADSSTCMPYASPAFTTLFGLVPEEVRDDATPLFERLHPEDLPHIWDTIVESAQTATPWRAETRVLHPERGEIWVEGQAVPRREPEGSILWYGAFTDISERRLADAALRESEALNRTVLNSVSSHVAVLDREGTIVAVNEAWRRFGRENSPIPGMSPLATDVGTNYLKALTEAIAYHSQSEKAEQIRAIHEGITEVLEGIRGVFTCEYTCTALDEPRWFLMNVHPLSSQRGGAVVTHFDVTEHRRAEEDRVYIMEHARCLLYQATVHEIGEPNLRWNIQYPPDVIGQQFLPLQVSAGQTYLQAQFLARPEEDRARCVALANISIRAGRSFEHEYRALAADSSIHWLHEAIRVETLEEGKMWRVVAVCTDITERKQAEIALHRQAEWQALLLEISRFLIMQVDLGAPLLNTLFEKIHRHLNIDHCYYYLWDNATASLRLVASIGLNEPFRASMEQLRLGETFCGTVAETHTSLNADIFRIETDPRGEVSRRLGLRAYSGHPLLTHDGAILGTLAFASTRRSQGFTQEEHRFLEMLCHFVGTTVERTRSETALRESEARLRTVTTTARVGLVVVDKDHCYRYCNRAFTEILRIPISPEEMPGRRIADVLTSVYDTQIRHRLDRAFQGERITYELSVPPSFLHPEERRYEFTYEPGGDPFDPVVVVVVIDITARKQAEQALRDSEQRLIRAQSLAHLGHMDNDARTGRIYWSDETFRILGYEPQQFEPTTELFFSRIHPDDRIELRRSRTELVEEGIGSQVEYRIIRPDGQVRWILGQGETIVDEAGQAIRFMGTLLDITERRAAEEELRYIVHSARCLFWSANVIDVGDPLLQWHILHYDEETAQRFMPLSVLPDQTYIYAAYLNRHPDDRARTTAYGTAQVRAGRSYSQEYRCLGGDGVWRWHREDVHVEIIAPDRWHIVAVITDVTDLKNAEAEIREINTSLEQRVMERTAQLESANKELESFSYSVSHDLRAPLRSISGFSEALLEDYQDALDDTGRDYLQRVYNTSQRMGLLIDDLLALSRVTGGEIERYPADLSKMAEEIVANIKSLDRERSSRVTFRIAAGLQASCDGRLARIVLENLLGNAWKYTSRHDHAQIEFDVLRQEETTPDEAIFFVRDDGAGFDMARAANLFGVFQRLHRASDFEGTGVGLATVQRIVHRHGGRIWAEAAPEKGATFFFTLGPGSIVS
jgi:PAS domain S-box-containing protein